MKAFLRNRIKHFYQKAHPVLSTVWFVLKYVEVFWMYPCVLSLPPPLARRVFRLRAPWLFHRPSQKRLILSHQTRAFHERMGSTRMLPLARRHALFLSSIRFDTQFILRCSAKKVDGTVRFEGLPYVDEAQENGKGVVLLGCHAGYFYRAILASARRGYKLHVITMRPEDAGQGVWKDKVGSLLYKKLVTRMQEEPNVELHFVGGPLLGIPRALRNREIVAGTLDVPLTAGEPSATRIEFLRTECHFSSRLIGLAARLNAVCLPYVTHAEGDVCRVKIYPAWRAVERDTPSAARVEEEMGYVFRILEKHILTYPEQWWLWNDLGGFGSTPGRRNGA